MGEDFIDHAIRWSIEGCLHFHGLKGENLIAFCDFCSDADGERADHAGDWCADFVGFRRVGFGSRNRFRLKRAIKRGRLAGRAIELEGNNAPPVLCRRANIDQLDEQSFALLDIDRYFLPRLQTIEKRGRRQLADIAILALEFRKVREDIRIHEMAVKVVVARLALELGGKFGANFCQIDFRRTDLGGLGFSKNDFHEFFRPSAHWFAKSPGKHVFHRLGKRRSGFEVQNIRRTDATGEEEECHVTDNLAGRRYFHDVAEEFIHLGIAVGDLRPTAGEAHAGGLFLEVGELPAGHFV